MNSKKQRDFGTTVYAHNHPSVESMIKRFKKRVSRAGILEEYRERMYYIKPSERKRRKRKLQEYKHAK